MKNNYNSKTITLDCLNNIEEAVVSAILELISINKTIGVELQELYSIAKSKIEIAGNDFNDQDYLVATNDLFDGKVLQAHDDGMFTINGMRDKEFATPEDKNYVTGRCVQAFYYAQLERDKAMGAIKQDSTRAELDEKYQAYHVAEEKPEKVASKHNLSGRMAPLTGMGLEILLYINRFFNGLTKECKIEARYDRKEILKLRGQGYLDIVKLGCGTRNLFLTELGKEVVDAQ